MIQKGKGLALRLPVELQGRLVTLTLHGPATVLEFGREMSLT